MRPQPAPAVWAGRRVARWLALLGVLASTGAQAQPPACQLLTESEGLVPLPGCTVAEGQPQLDATALAALPYDAQGLAVVHAGGSFHYVERTGRSLAVITWDNGPDTLQEGLLRGRVGERIGYFDVTLRQVIEPTFDFAWPFHDGVAEVCNGCQRGTPDADGHTPMEGGDWFRIDRRGRRVR
ncbi:hypothetical protein C1922_13845 [Stenotrophomonas sp. ZAC14D2_NAIMI4_7]|uniref:WG repeat-containing protein n=1 Tax=Stenotrophomonas sp. ZAC14D2_NAIMI4_7 TaxID=2072405 RepID=UPI000D540F08|nr:WG repeat-containing protein [Stenotrophomonas sp. ZAC14D2_NAIMI4_7]AWH18302.1 hypothetical protein C1922_13845 [Stenotrophomonas sp. ZAC14D2_NAIMI4_7]